MSTFDATYVMPNGIYVGTFLTADSLHDAELLAASWETEEYTLRNVYLIEE